MDKISSSDVFAVIIGGILGAAISLVAFIFRSRRERKSQINEALFQLLGVWRGVFVGNTVTSDAFFKATIQGLRRRYPNENIPDELADAIKEAAVANLPKIIGIEGGSLAEAYEESVGSLSHIFPVKAHKLLGNTHLIGYIHRVDKWIPESEKAGVEPALASMRASTYKDAFKELEGDLLYLAWKSGPFCWLEVRSLVKRNKEKMESIPGEFIDEYVETVFVPLIEAQRAHK